jgi:hypothetical protein
MNNVDILLGKLKIFPSTDICRFYCPTDQQYYYVMNDGVRLRNEELIIVKVIPNDFCANWYFNMTYRQVIRDISFFIRISKANQLKIHHQEIKENEFKLL